MKRRLKDVTEVLDIPASAAAILLREHNWSKERLLEIFYSSDSTEALMKKHGCYFRCHPAAASTSANNSKKSATGTSMTTRSSSSSSNKADSSNSSEDLCAICYDTPEQTLSMPCGHSFCTDCWHDFCVNAVQEEGPACVRTSCPQADCNEIITEEEFQAVAPDQLTKFQGYQLRNFVESNKLTRWCPGKGCERVAVAYNASALETDGSHAHCDTCGTDFCLPCGEEPHLPCGCKDLALWNEKCRNESETANWILANTKSCPKCVSRIEKNQGCNHMTCQRCRYEFCWICMGDWNDHGANTGGYYKCNKYDPAGGSGGASGAPEDQSDAAKAKRELDRYLHYYKRYHAHAEAQKFAKKQLKETEARMVLLQESSDDAKWSDVEFLKTANEQLVECRRVLKYTYVFAYYMTAKSAMTKERFEHHQEMLERFTENLSELSEKPLHEMDRTDVVNQVCTSSGFLVCIFVESSLSHLMFHLLLILCT